MVVARGSRRSLVALGVTALVAVGCSTADSGAIVTSSSPDTASRSVRETSRWPDIYAHAVHAAAKRGLRVWLDADLASRWLESRGSFREAVGRLRKLAGMRGVAGIKIADELGYNDGFDGDAERVKEFLARSARALHRVAPGKSILVDVLVPELGCAPGVTGGTAVPATACATEARAKYPAITLEQVDSMLQAKTVDVVDLSTGLLSPEVYRSWGITIADAQRLAWREVARRGWADLVRLQGRKALAFPGTYPYDRTRAEEDLRVFVDIPTQLGARAIDIWTWRRLYDGQIVRLTDPGLKPSPLWLALLERHAEGDRLFTHFTPSSLEVGLGPDLDALSQAFTSVFVAAGTG